MDVYKFEIIKIQDSTLLLDNSACGVNSKNMLYCAMP
jgi:hypothetical protein